MASGAVTEAVPFAVVGEEPRCCFVNNKLQRVAVDMPKPLSSKPGVASFRGRE